jgi:hypothetical protein
LAGDGPDGVKGRVTGEVINFNAIFLLFIERMIASTLALASAALATTIPVGNGSVPNRNEVSIRQITVNGSGCPQGSVAAAISDDLSSFTLLFSEFIASSGPNVAAPENRKNCQINIDIRYPQGWSYSVATIDYRGFVGIPAGVTAIQRSTYYFSGSTQQSSVQSRWVGPRSEDYLVRNQVPISQIVWSRCGRTERGNVNTQIRLEGDLTKSGQMTVDSIDGTLKQIYGIQWKRC